MRLLFVPSPILTSNHRFPPTVLHAVRCMVNERYAAMHMAALVAAGVVVETASSNSPSPPQLQDVVAKIVQTHFDLQVPVPDYAKWQHQIKSGFTTSSSVKRPSRSRKSSIAKPQQQELVLPAVERVAPEPSAQGLLGDSAQGIADENFGEVDDLPNYGGDEEVEEYMIFDEEIEDNNDDNIPNETEFRLEDSDGFSD